MRDLWVFGYGSLMWRPGFDFKAAVPALLYGAHRALCVYSWVHRGTQERPGLVLGLDQGGSCRGVAFKVAAKNASSVVEYLREREQVTMVYKEAYRPIRLLAGDGTSQTALCFVVDRNHDQYAGVLDADHQARLVRQGRGQSGENPDYVFNTVTHLEELGVHDTNLLRVRALLK